MDIPFRTRAYPHPETPGCMPFLAVELANYPLSASWNPMRRDELVELRGRLLEGVANIDRLLEVKLWDDPTPETKAGPGEED